MPNTIQIALHAGDRQIVFQPFPFQNRFTVGDRSADIPVRDCPGGARLIWEKSGEGYVLRAEGCRINDPAETEIRILDAGEHQYRVFAPDGKALFSVKAALIPLPHAPEYDRLVEVPSDKTIRIGGNADADFVLHHSLITGAVCEISLTGSGWIIRPSASVPLGLFANDKRIDQQVIVPEGSFLFAPGMHLFLGKDQLRMPSRDGIAVMNLPYLDESEQNSHLNYPCINRTSRQILAAPDEPIFIQDPPAAREPPKKNLLITLLPVLLMILVTVFVRSAFMDNGNGSGMIIFSAVSLAVGGLTSAITYFQTVREAKKKNAKRAETYRRYIEECEKRIREKRDEEVRILHSIYISPQRETRNIDDFSADLFDRRQDDADFLDILFGYGKLRSRQPVTCKTHEVFESVDELFDLPLKLREKYAFQEGLPAVVRARNARAIGITGDIAPLRGIIRNVTLDLIARHFYEDVRLYYFLSDLFLPEKAAFRMLPHVKDQDSGRRNIACDDESKAQLLDLLFKELCRREAESGSKQPWPWLVIFVYADGSSIMRHPIMKFVEKADALHAVMIFLSLHRDLLPQGCTVLVRLASNTDMGVISTLTESAPDRLFSYEPVSDQTLDGIGLRLAPVFSSEMSLASHLSSSETLFSMLGIRSEAELDVPALWHASDTTKHIAAPLGILDNGRVLQLDLHETVHGPHGLVAGTTGSGKSQVLISFILSLATRYSPEDVTFAVIDFKGGDIVKQLPGLPHIVGSITNLSKDEINRSLRSINAEKNKRMMLFDENHANVSNITEYTRAYHAGRIRTPLPHLVIIVDEFAELRAQFPESMQELISISRVGRSLGIHMILCTQKPAGVVDGQIRSNSDFQLCLRVQTREDSNEVLGSPLAAEIHEPGRGYLQVGRTEQFELFQSGYSGAMRNQSERVNVFALWDVDLSGKRHLLYEQKAETEDQAVTQREAVLGEVLRAYADAGMQPPAPLCLPPLPELLAYEDTAEAAPEGIPIGIYDDPDTQSMRTMCVDIDARNTLIVGNSQMGKTNLLLTMIRSLAEHDTAAQIQVYAMDYSAKAIKSLEGLDIIGGVVIEGEDDKLKSLLKLLREEIERRKTVIMQAGATTFRAYRALQSDLPAILLLIDNYAIFNERYEESLGDALTFILREGPALGICSVVTVQNMSVLNYRKAYLFPERIALPLGDRSQYGSVFEGCRQALREIPGRALIQLDKKFFEGQVYEAFSGRTEAERIRATQAFVTAHRGSGCTARPIPEIPETLTLRYIQDTFPGHKGKDEIAIAMDYGTVSPVYLNLQRAFSLSLIGGDEQARFRFAAMLIRSVLRLPDSEVYLFDRYDRPLKQAAGNDAGLRYEAGIEGVGALFERMKTALEEQLAAARASEDGTPEGPLFLVVFNSEESLRELSEQSALMKTFHAIAEQYRRMRVFFLFSDVPNKVIRYNSPDLLKFIGDEKQALFFSELNTIKAFDIPYPTIRAMGGAAGIDDAFLMQEEEMTRLKLVREAD